MIHDRWANVLFLHWRIPPHLEDVLRQSTAPFLLDRYDGSAWIGLILLTEHNVGPSIGRSRWTCVTHHGVNVRTYVRGVDRDAGATGGGGEDDGGDSPGGIHFSSLECDDEFTSFGANFFGMPYRVAKVVRSYCVEGTERQRQRQQKQHEEKEMETVTTTERTRSADEAACCINGQISGNTINGTVRYRVRSQRLRSAAPSFFRILFRTLQWPATLLHSTKLRYDATNTDAGDPSVQNDGTKEDDRPVSHPPTMAADTQPFTVDCTWTRYDTPLDDNGARTVEDTPAADRTRDTDSRFSHWAVERYFVFTQKYGRMWRGQVEHEPWSVERGRLERLEMSGIDNYEPECMRPILRFVAGRLPDSVLFSPGVGPVRFNMLQSV